MVGPYTFRIKDALFEVLDREKPAAIISGMALGTDQIWAICGIHREMPVIAAVPFEGQEGNWPNKSKKLYRDILAKPNVLKVVVCEGGYEAYKMQARNKWMVDHCDKLVAVWDGTEGGTANCVKYAESIGKQVIRINPK